MSTTKQYSKNYPILNTLGVARVVLETSKLAKEIGFRSSAQTIIATITSELGRNILTHAGNGYIELSIIANKKTKGIEIIAKDQGPGIEDIEKAMQESYSTKGTLGLGLPAVKRMSDELEIKTEVGKGTSITVKKWLTHGNN